MTTEVHQHAFDRYLYEYFNLETNLTPFELEKTFWDVDGANGAGMYPVWYTGNTFGEQESPKVPHLPIKDWSELIAKLDAMSE